jgi:hypothetical protein
MDEDGCREDAEDAASLHVAVPSDSSSRGSAAVADSAIGGNNASDAAAAADDDAIISADLLDIEIRPRLFGCAPFRSSSIVVVT